jgi:hypothetical protein
VSLDHPVAQWLVEDLPGRRDFGTVVGTTATTCTDASLALFELLRVLLERSGAVSLEIVSRSRSNQVTRINTELGELAGGGPEGGEEVRVLQTLLPLLLLLLLSLSLLHLKSMLLFCLLDLRLSVLLQHLPRLHIPHPCQRLP